MVRDAFAYGRSKRSNAGSRLFDLGAYKITDSSCCGWRRICSTDIVVVFIWRCCSGQVREEEDHSGLSTWDAVDYSFHGRFDFHKYGDGFSSRFGRGWSMSSMGIPDAGPAGNHRSVSR